VLAVCNTFKNILNMETEKTSANIGKGEIPETTQIDRISGVLRYGATWHDVCYFGWSNKGAPCMVTDKKLLSNAAQQKIELVRMAGITIPNIEIIGTLNPVEFVTEDLPIDFHDQPDHKVQDLLNLVVSDNKGSMQTVYVRELDMLKAITKQTVEWQEATRESVLTKQSINANNLYTVIIPDAKKANTYYALMFKTPLPTESNEYTYKKFIIDVVMTLFQIDQNQRPEDRKGYFDIMKRLVGDDKKPPEGTAYKIMKSLHDMGYIKKSKEEMEQLQSDSQNQGVTDQLLLLLRESGYLNKNLFRTINKTTPQSASEELKQMSVKDLFDFVEDIRQRVKTSF
jgi:hypothetical protein